MSESMASPQESAGENKLFGKHKWRVKLFSADSRFGRAAENHQSTDDDIANFLHTTGARPEARPRSGPLAPHSDAGTGSGRSSATQEDQNHPIVDVYRRPKSRQNKGLHVRFESAPPAIIGVGGDETELPSRHVSKSFADSVGSRISPSREPSHYNTNDQRSHEYGRSTDPYNETSFRPLCLQRRPTGVDDEPLADDAHHAGHDRETVQSAFAGTRKLSPRRRDEEQNLDLDLQRKDILEVSYEPSSASEDPSFDQSCTWQTAETRSRGPTRHSDIPPPEALRANSLTPSELPEPLYVPQEASSSSYYVRPASRDLPKLPDPGRQGIGQDSEVVSHNPEDKLLSLRTVAQSLEDESLDDFDSRVRRFDDLFRLNASAHVDIMAVPFERWVRISAWWFLKGRGGLENAVRRKSSVPASANAVNDGGTSKQAYVHLAKAWWVLKDVTPNLPEIRRFGNATLSSMVGVIRSFGDQPLAELVEVHLDIFANMRALTMSMKRNGRLPPDDLQMQRLESQIFLETSTFPLGIAALIVNNVLGSSIRGKNCVTDPFFPILVGNTARHFSFGNMFVDVRLESRDDAKSGVIPCVVSILRERTDWAVKVAVASQDGQVNLVIQSGEHGGLLWHGMQWKIPQHTMQLGLAENISLRIKFSEKDFKTIWGICDYTQQMQKAYSAKRGEEVVYERELPIVQCSGSPSFPAEPIKDCRVRLFEKKVFVIEDSGQHRVHDGYRLMVITHPGTKTLNKVNYQLGKDMPILFSTHQSKGRDTLLVRVPSSLRLSLTFHEASDVELFRSILAGTSITEDDHCPASLQLQNYTISPVSGDQDTAYINASRCISDLRWQKLRVVNKGPPVHGHDSQSTVRSERLRIVADCDSGTFTDRINAGPGELQLNLSLENLNEIKLLRAAQQDMTWSFADGVLRDAELSSLCHMLHLIGTSPSVRTYHFRSLSDVHSFQAMLTGFHVLYDGLASTFSISRPRMVVPLSKRWEASTPRLQIIQQDKTVQLVAFFKNFSHGGCMNFVLKVTDCFDTFARSGVFFLRIVDAKFALPKGESDPARDFVCLDMPEYPGEHDDIIIGFDNEQGEHLKSLIGSSAKNLGLTELQTEIDLPVRCQRLSTKCLEWHL